MTSVQYLIVLDFEATCDDQTQLEPQEIIEFPSVLIDIASKTVIDEIQTYVRPLRHPALTRFCTSLTGITQVW
jgi:ERI1 exoribonuclease 2